MDALVSGSAARAFFIEGIKVSYVEADDPEITIACSTAVANQFVEDNPDVVNLKNTTKTAALGLLLKKWEIDRGLRMLQIILDDREVLEIRCEASILFSSIIEKEEVRYVIENWCYALPLDREIDASFLTEGTQAFTIVSNFVQNLLNSQEIIRKYRSAWQSVNKVNFLDDSDRCSFEMAAIELGVFRNFVLCDNDPKQAQAAIFQCYKDLFHLNNSRRIIGEWTKRVIEKKTRKEIAKASRALENIAYEENEWIDTEGGVPSRAHEINQNVKKQQNGIKEKLHLDDAVRAHHFTQQLIEYQMQNGGSKYAAQSLCNLAQEAKQCGYTDLQLRWLKQATEIAPRDGVVHGQLGDAYISLFRFTEAQTEFELAQKFGNEVFGKMGCARVLHASGQFDDALKAFDLLRKEHADHDDAPRAWQGYAETLRDMWRLRDALSIYEQATQRFSDICPLWCGRAAVLTDLGKLSEAEAVYLDTIKKFKHDVVPRSGQAAVLKKRGNFEKALSVYQETIALFPDEYIPQCGKANVLSGMGEHSAALEVYEKVQKRFPNEPSIISGHAEVLKKAELFNKALILYTEAREKFNLDARICNGRANILKSMGKFEDALQAYDQNVKDFPYDLFSLSGRADLLKELGHHEESLKAYEAIIARRPDYFNARVSKAAVLVILNRFDEAEALLPTSAPQTKIEWIGNHIRGMILLKQNKLEEALSHFTYGAKHIPFYDEKKYYDNALVLTNLRLGNFPEAAQIARQQDTVVSRLLQMHAYSVAGFLEQALSSYTAINDNKSEQVIKLREELAARYGLIERKVEHDEMWIYEQETTLLLQAA